MNGVSHNGTIELLLNKIKQAGAALFVLLF